ncbi:MAG: hypothetical protein HQL73_00630 [Magnetococcales bacterium]|nr:hypothetical protein [Magnetococcales bacterium]
MGKGLFKIGMTGLLLTGIPGQWLFATPIPASPFVVVPPGGPDKCLSCHGWRQPDPTPRTLKKPHDTIVLTHWPQPGPWCGQCHDLKQPRRLFLYNDQSVDFREGYRLCGQCHGAKVTDWMFGAHGKRVTDWRGPRKIQACRVCHDPHQPQTKPVVPSAPPAPPGTSREWNPVVPPTHTLATSP